MPVAGTTHSANGSRPTLLSHSERASSAMPRCLASCPRTTAVPDAAPQKCACWLTKCNSHGSLMVKCPASCHPNWPSVTCAFTTPPSRPPAPRVGIPSWAMTIERLQPGICMKLRYFSASRLDGLVTDQNRCCHEYLTYFTRSDEMPTTHPEYGYARIFGIKSALHPQQLRDESLIKTILYSLAFLISLNAAVTSSGTSWARLNSYRSS